MNEKTLEEIDAERFVELEKTDLGPISSAYAATFAYHHMIVQARFTTAGLFFAMGAILSAAILSDRVGNREAWYLGAFGVLFSVFVLFLDARNRHLLTNCVARGLRYERRMNISTTNGFFGLMLGPQDEPKKRLVSHSAAIFGLYLLSIVFFIALPVLKK